MKIVSLSTSDLNGGAAKAAFRHLKALQKSRIDCNMLVQEKKSDNQYVKGPITKLQKGINVLHPEFDQIPVRFYKSRMFGVFSSAWWPNKTLKRILAEEPDIINLNWISGGFIRIESLSNLKIPIVWTLHDMWPFTGGCHYSGNCEKYFNECGGCPQLKSNKMNDLSHSIWKRKQRAWEKLNLTVVSPSRWLASCAKRSSLFKNYPIEVIPYCIDLDRFAPTDKIHARKLLGLPKEKKLILFGAMSATSDPRKGFGFLQEALQYLYKKNQELAEIVIFGSSGPKSSQGLGLKKHYFGTLYDDISISLLFTACDVFAAPSIEDNLPLTVMEALSCGTPCVAFDIGGMPDMIEHKINGYLAKSFETEDLANGINWVLEDKTRSYDLSLSARAKAEKEFSEERIAKRYTKLYEDLLGK
ncbi:MAG: glycosyltransferase family 4 protein [Deltaproteobacteria bacterium]|jgi:glycosyltransferase involved in cell wall biosynthesis|nr:glycosyltransferase family 4 protein [Deltaproteobacteria bacterium]